jgi:HemY protein
VKALFWVLALFGLAVAVALGARVNDGYVLLVLPPYRAEVSLNLFILALVALVLVLYVALRTLALTFGLPRRARSIACGASASAPVRSSRMPCACSSRGASGRP